MINVSTYDALLRKELTQEDYRDYSYGQRKADESIEKHPTRNALFWTRRYALRSYKAVKAGISRPSVMMKYEGDKFRLYGTPDNNKLFGAMTKSSPVKTILAGWKARSKAEMRALKLASKKRRN